MNHIKPIVALLAAAAVAAATSEATAQRTSTANSGGSSMFGGSSSFGGSSLGGSSLGGGTLGGAGGFGGATGQSGLGAGLGGQAGGQSGFVGRDSSEVANFFGVTNPFSGQAGGRGTQTRGAMNRGRDVNSQDNARPPVMVTVSLGFEPPATPVEYQARQTATRLNAILARQDLSDAKIEVADGVAYISGSATESQLRVLKRLARLEPGVSRVEDRTGEAPTLLPPPRYEDDES